MPASYGLKPMALTLPSPAEGVLTPSPSTAQAASHATLATTTVRPAAYVSRCVQAFSVSLHAVLPRYITCMSSTLQIAPEN